MSKINLYQILVRLFGNTNDKCVLNGSRKENGVGKFKDINNTALKKLKKAGISHIWYTGVLEHAIVEGYPKADIPSGNPQIIKGRAGSPYAIKDYYDVNPDLATSVKNRLKEFDQLIERTHKNGLKVIIDFVPNHVARFYQSDKKTKGVIDFGANDEVSNLFSSQNDFYYLKEDLVLPQNSGCVLESDAYEPYIEMPAKATGNDQFYHQPSINDWYETIKLNYGVDYQNGRQGHFTPLPSVWSKMLDIIHYWASKGVDGFRCDMAEMVPVEFWGWMINNIKKEFPKLIFIAEIYNPDAYRTYIHQGKFDYLYDKVGVYDALRGIMQHGNHAGVLTHCWQQLEGIQNNMLRFLENHDEQRLASKYFLGEPHKAKAGMILSATMHNGPLMIYFGQEVGEPAEGASGFSGDDGRTTIFDYWNVPTHQQWRNEGRFDGKLLSKEQKGLQQFYNNLLNLCQQHEAFYSGQFYDLMWSNQHEELDSHHIYTYLRHTTDSCFLVVLNFDNEHHQQCTVHIPKHALECAGIAQYNTFKITSYFGETQPPIHVSSDKIESEGISMIIPPHDGIIFKVEKG